MEEMEEKGAFDFEDTGFHEPPKIPEPPSLKEMGADISGTEGVVMEEIPEEVSAAEVSAVPEAPEPAPPPPAAEPAPPKPAEKTPAVEKAQAEEAVEAKAAKPPDVAPKPATPPKPVHKPARRVPSRRKIRPPSKRIPSSKPAPPTKEEIAPSPAPRPAPISPPPVPTPPPKASKLPWVAALIFLVGCAVLGFLFWQKTKEIETVKKDAEAKVNEARREANAEVEKFKKRIDELETAKQALRTEKQRLEKDKTDLEARLKTKEQSIESLTKRIREMRSQIDELDNLRLRIRRLQDSLSAKDKMLNAQRQLTEEALRKKKEIEARMAGYEDAVKKLTEDLKNARREIERLKKYGSGDVAARFMREKEALLQRIRSLEKENAQLQEEIARAKVSGPASSLQRRLKELRQRLAKATREKVALREALLKTNARLKRYISPVETLKEWNEAVRSGDIRRVASLYSHNSLFWKRWTGAERGALEREFEKTRSAGTFQMEVESVTIKGGKAIAVVTLRSEGGKVFKGVFRLVLEGDKWRIMGEEY